MIKIDTKPLEELFEDDKDLTDEYVFVNVGNEYKLIYVNESLNLVIQLKSIIAVDEDAPDFIKISTTMRHLNKEKNKLKRTVKAAVKSLCK